MNRYAKVIWSVCAVAMMAACAVDAAPAETIAEPSKTTAPLSSGNHTYVNCSDDEQTIIEAAIDEGIDMGNAALAELYNNPMGDRVRYWFGNDTDDVYGWLIIHGTLQDAVNRLQNDDIQFTCVFNPGEWCDSATVENARPGFVDVDCQLLYGYDFPEGYRRGPVMVHEMTHFDNTSDVNCEGRLASRQLAESDPVSAAFCAGNYQFFVENPPTDPLQEENCNRSVCQR
jgi:hypothetical protein